MLDISKGLLFFIHPVDGPFSSGIHVYACIESERWLNYERHKQRRRYTAKVRHGEDWSSRHKIVAEI